MPGPGPAGTRLGAKIPGNIRTGQKMARRHADRVVQQNRVLLECTGRATIGSGGKMKTDKIRGNMKIDRHGMARLLTN